eukprot:TRINITY_DN17995_c0_g1_i4.p1 TRINITY_DN17995_c0_g1~~TRINITY_DN17995_c0_g1_i4.p1  ORF type:complete len:938 (-),score=274.59 TRINITY_DN17995_c0_g1_i4:262-3075(-)
MFFFFFFFKQKTAYEMLRSLVGSEMCIRDRVSTQSTGIPILRTMSHGHSHGGQGGGHGHGHGPSAPPKDTFVGEDLFIAATNDHHAYIIKLLEGGSHDPNILDQHGVTPLHRAVESRAVQSVQALAYGGANVNWAGSWAVQETPLHWAARAGDKAVEVLKVLLALGADVNARDAHGYTAMHHAASNTHASLCCQLLQACGAELSVVDCERRTPLHLAAAQGNSSMCFFLADKGADPHAFDQSGQTAAGIADAKGHKDLARGLSGDKNELSHYLGPWLMQGFQRPNQMLTAKDIGIPMVATPTMFYLFGVLPWYLSILASGVMMALVGTALVPKKGAKVKANPSLHTFYISCVVFTYVVLINTVGVTGQNALLMLFFFCTTAVMVMCFAACSYSDPGVIPHSEQDYRDCMLAGERGVSTEGLCTTCMIRKPIRSKHCGVMNVCIAEFDHFCPWCNNAVGHCNYLAFCGWCLFEFVNHLQIVYFMYTWMMAEIGATSIFPLIKNLLAMNETHPTVLYLCIFNLLCCMMAFQLTWFQAGSIVVNLTTNERMNAHRYSYLMEHQQNQLAGNPYDRGGFVPNLKALLKRRLWDSSMPEFQYKSLDLDIEKVAGETVAEQLDIYNAGEGFMFASEINRSAVHRFISSVYKSAGGLEAEEDIRTLLPHLLRRVSIYPHSRQQDLLQNLLTHMPLDHGARLDLQLLATIKEVEAEHEEKQQQVMAQAAEMQAKIQEVGSATHAYNKVANPEAKEVDAKKQALLNQHEYAFQHRRVIAQQVLTPQQLVVFMTDHAAMEDEVTLKEKRKLLTQSQEKMKPQLSPDQQSKIQEYMKARVGEWIKAQPAGLPPPEPLTRDLPDEVIEYLLKENYVCAQRVMEQDQFTIFADGYSDALKKDTLEEKQLALMQVQKKLMPLLSAAQREESKKFLQIKLIEYNQQNGTSFWS